MDRTPATCLARATHRSDRVRVAATAALVIAATCLAPGSGWSQTGGDLSWRVMGGGGASSTAPNLRLEGTIGQPFAGVVAASSYDLTAGFWAVVAPPECVLDVDGNGVTEVATDVVYIARHLLALTPVPPSFRVGHPAIPPDAAVAARIDAAGAVLDVDNNGVVEVATDIVYIARHLLSLTPVPPSFRAGHPTIPPDAVIASAIDGLCPR